MSHKQLWQQNMLDWLILFLCPLSIAVDMANGFILLSGSSLPVSVAYKSGLLLLLLVRLAITDLRLVVGLLSLLLLYILPAWRLFLMRGDFALFFLDFSFALRLLFFLSFLIYILVTQPNFEKIQTIVKWLVLALAFNLLIGAAGLGFPTYSAADGFGIKGFIFAGNELAITLIALTYFVLFRWVKNKPWLIKMAAVLLVIFSGLLVATKSAMLGTIAVAGLFMLLHTRKTFFLVCTALLVLLVVFSAQIFELIKAAGIIDRFIFFYNKSGFITLVFSGREEFFYSIKDFALQNFGLLGWVIGWSQGAFVGFLKTAVEIDLLDLYIFYGITGFFSFCLYFYLIYRILNINGGFKRLPSISIWLLILAISFFAGHVVYSGVAAIPLTLALYATAAKNNHRPATRNERLP